MAFVQKGPLFNFLPTVGVMLERPMFLLSHRAEASQGGGGFLLSLRIKPAFM
jgi:hypothetical protein